GADRARRPRWDGRRPPPAGPSCDGGPAGGRARVAERRAQAQAAAPLPRRHARLDPPPCENAPMSLASIDGPVMAAAEATIPVTDEGLLRGDGVFEVIRLYEGRPFAFD